MVTPRMNDAIYDILVRDVGALEHWRDKFRAVDLTQPLPAFYFGGQVGLGGRFGIDDEGCWFVAMDPAYRTPKRETMVMRANAALRELQGT